MRRLPDREYLGAGANCIFIPGPTETPVLHNTRNLWRAVRPDLGGFLEAILLWRRGRGSHPLTVCLLADVSRTRSSFAPRTLSQLGDASGPDAIAKTSSPSISCIARPAIPWRSP